MFNKQLKSFFINENTERKEFYEEMFNELKVYEEEYNKDLYEFNEKDFTEMNPKIKYVLPIRDYLKWALNNDYTNNKDVFNLISRRFK